jgi:hypothetical protein
VCIKISKECADSLFRFDASWKIKYFLINIKESEKHLLVRFPYVILLNNSSHFTDYIRKTKCAEFNKLNCRACALFVDSICTLNMQLFGGGAVGCHGSLTRPGVFNNAGNVANYT